MIDVVLSRRAVVRKEVANRDDVERIMFGFLGDKAAHAAGGVVSRGMTEAVMQRQVV